MPFQAEESESRSPKFFDKFALFSAVVSLLCVLGAHAMDLMAKDGTFRALASGRSQTVDYSTTASIGKSSNVTLNPCGNR